MKTEISLTYKQATATDFNAIYELYMDEQANPYLTYDPMDKNSFRILFDELLETGTLYITRSNNEAAGTYRLIRKTHRQEHILYLGGFAVKKEFNGKGFGKQILDHIKQGAAAQGIKRIELTVDIANERAIHLYKKAGFEIQALLKMNYKLSSTGEYYDEYLMAVIL